MSKSVNAHMRALIAALVALLCMSTAWAEGDWHWSATYSAPNAESGFAEGDAPSFEEAEAAMKAACSYCDILTLDTEPENTIGEKLFTYKPNPQDFPAELTDWQGDLPVRLTELENANPSSPECSPSVATPISEWYAADNYLPTERQKIDIEVAINHYSSNEQTCNVSVRGPYQGVRTREAVCPTGYAVVWVYNEDGEFYTNVCRAVTSGSVRSPHHICECDQDYVNGQCESREVTWASAEKSQKNGHYRKLSEPNNEGFRCSEVVPSQSCPAEAPLADVGLKGNPIHCADGQKVQIEVDYQAPLGRLSIGRIYSSEPEVDLTEFYDSSFSTLPANVQALKYYRLEDPTWLVNIPRLLDFGGDLKAVQPGNGARYLFYQWQAGLPHFGTLEELDDGALFRDANGTELRFNAEGQIVRKQYRDGQYLDYQFVSDTETVITDNFGRSVTLAHLPPRQKSKNEIGPIVNITDPDGQVTQFGIDEDDMITSVTYPGNALGKTYAYEKSGDNIRLVEMTDELGVAYARWSYDDLARGVLSAHHSDAEKVEIEFVAADVDEGEYTSITRDYLSATEYLETEYQFTTLNGAKKPTRITEAPCTDCVTATTDFLYSSQGMLDRVAVQGGTTTDYNYTQTGLLTSITEAVGTSDARTTSVSWHAEFAVPTQISRPGSTTTYTHDTQGNILSKTLRDSATGRSRTVSYTYNSVGQVLSIDGPRTDVADRTEFTYSANGNLLTVTNALNHTTLVTEHDALGRPLAITDPNGVVTRLTYHPRGWLTSITEDGDTTVYTYNAAGLLSQVQMANGVSLQYEYDTAHRLAGIQDGLGNKIEYTLDLQGNRTRTELLDPNGVVTSYVTQAFNNLGQLITRLGAEGQQQRWAYDLNGQVVTSTDALGLDTHTEFDALQRTTRQVDPAQYATQFEYDAHQQVNKVIDAMGEETTYKRNVFGDVLERVSTRTGREVFTYDEAGNLLTKSDARNLVTQRQYDALNRRVATTFADGVDDITYFYDDTSGGNPGVGRLTGIDDASGSIRYRYDAHGQVIHETRVINGVTFVTQYAYDAAGLLTHLTYPSGRVVTYQRNSAGQVSSVLDGGQTLAQSVQTLPFGPLTSLTYGNGLSLTRDYDTSYRLQRSRVTSLLDDTYGYTARDNISTIVDGVNGASPRSYQYDALERVTDESGDDGAQHYDYDGIGNRLRVVAAIEPPLSYAYTAHRLKSVGPESEEPDPTATRVFAVQATRSTSVAYSTPVGEQQLYHCPANLLPLSIRGTGIYTSFSSLCTAAMHAGELDQTAGGLVLIEVLGAQDAFTGSSQNGVNSYDYGSYAKSYRVLPLPAWYAEAEVIVHAPNPWSQTANSYKNDVGGEYVFGCPPDTSSAGYIYGTDTYRASSRVCLAGVHTGLLDRTQGGQLIATIEADPGSYVGSTQNGITSLSGAAWYGAYTLAVPGETGVQRYRYDAAGNTLSKGALSFTYDALGRLRTASRDGLRAEYDYDARHLRTQKTVNGVSTVYLYDLDGQLIAESDVYGTITREYVYVDGQRLALYDNGTRYYIHSNHLDVPQALTDDAGVVQWQGTVSTFGVVTPQLEQVVQNLRFPGQYYDQETGLHYNWHRYYDPETGRYVTSDPIGLDDGPNTYAYVKGNPVNYYDPDGLTTVSACAMPQNIPTCAAAGIIGGASLDFGINVGVQAYQKGWSCIDWGEARGAAVEGGVYGLLGFGAGLVVAKFSGRLLRGLGRGFRGHVDDVAEAAVRNVPNNGKTFYRSMSKAEASAVKDTGKLRGGNPGDTFFTDSKFKTATKAQDRLSLPNKPEVQMEFRIKNNPTMQRNGTKVTPDYGGRGGGKEYMTSNPVEVEIINVQPY